MKLPEYRWWVVVLIAFGVFALLWGINQWHDSRRSDTVTETLCQISGVLEADVEAGLVSIDVSADVDLVSLVEEAESVVSKYGYDIEVKDNSSIELIQIYDRIHYAVYEGIRTGRFTDMIDRVETEVVSYRDVDVSIRVRLNRVYLQLRSGEYHLCRVIDF